jgi:acetolactate synthase-1/2/3 large subunit
MTSMSGADALLAQLLENGVATIFGLPGGQLDHFFDSMYRCSDRVRFIGSRHEQGAGYMAFGYARSTGRPGVYTVVPGPGVLNTATALCTAYATNAPVLCVTGQIPSEGLGRGIGYLHELPDQLATLRSITRWAARIMTPGEAPATVNEAFARLNGGRRGPVSLEMPMDVMGRKGEVAVLPRATPLAPPALDTDRIEQAARRLARAERPMIVIGSGALDAADELLELASLVQAPVVAFRGGRGVISDRHYLSQVLPAGYELWKSADVAVGIGTRMEQQLLHWKRPPRLDVIRIDIDADELARIEPPAIGIHADAREAIVALTAALRRTNLRAASRRDELVALKERIAAETSRVQPQMAFLQAIRRALPDDGFFVDEITQVGYASWYGFPTYAPRHHVNCGYQGTLGYGYATALGVKVANPDRAVVNIAGDGGFLFTANEMATAAQYDIGLVTVLFNNGKFQNVQRQQREWFGGRLIGSDLRNPDFVRYGESFGIRSTRLTGPDSLEPAIHAALERNEPALIEVPCGDMASPWPHIIKPPATASAAGAANT